MLRLPYVTKIRVENLTMQLDLMVSSCALGCYLGVPLAAFTHGRAPSRNPRRPAAAAYYIEKAEKTGAQMILRGFLRRNKFCSLKTPHTVASKTFQVLMKTRSESENIKVTTRPMSTASQDALGHPSFRRFLISSLVLSCWLFNTG
jgi:hypothetical protein